MMNAMVNLDMVAFDWSGIEENTKEPELTFIFSGFGYELYKNEELPFGSYVLMNGDGTFVGDEATGLLTFDTTLEAKKWMKDHKTSECWRADGKWDWSREVIA